MLSHKLINKNFQILAKSSYKFIEEQNKKYIKRKKETDLFDAFAFKIQYTKKEMSQSKITNKINDFKKTTTKRSCFVDRMKLIDENLLFSYYDHLDKDINSLFYNNKNITYQICAVDGTKANAYATTINQSFKTTKSKDIFTFLSIGFFNVTYNDPCLLRCVEHKNERKGLLDNLNINKNPTIYVTDRGFLGNTVFKTIENNNDYFICRIRHNNLINNKNISDQVIPDYNGLKYARILNYKIKNLDYHIITNIPQSMYSIDDIKNIYHKRWNIEEYFKYIKNNMKMESFKERDWKSIKTSIYMNFIISKLTYLIFNLYKKKIKNNNRTINKNLLTYELYNDFLLKFIYNKQLSERFLIKFFKKAIDIIVTNLDKKNVRRSMYPHTKWNTKGHYNKVIIEEK